MTKQDDWVTGIHAVTELLRNRPQDVSRLLVVDAQGNSRLAAVCKLAHANQVQFESLSRQALGEIYGEARQGVAARISGDKSGMSEKALLAMLDELDHPPLLLVLDGITDPHNLGACLRTADAAGADAVIIPKDKSASLNATVRKVSSGAAETVKLVTVTNLARCLKALQKKNIWLVGTEGSAETDIFSQDLTGPIALIMGSEGSGLRRLTRDCCDFLVAIPMAGKLGSLNVSVATGIALFEAVRQRSQALPGTRV